MNSLRRLIGLAIEYLTLSNQMLRYLLWVLTVRPTGLGVCVQIKEEVINMAQVFTYTQGLLPVTKVGVVNQRLVVTVDGVPQEPIVVPVEATEVVFKAGPVGATVGRSLDYLDAAGNDSDNFVAPDFVIEDKVAPEAPEGFGELTQVAEEEV